VANQFLVHFGYLWLSAQSKITIVNKMATGKMLPAVTEAEEMQNTVSSAYCKTLIFRVCFPYAK